MPQTRNLLLAELGRVGARVLARPTVKRILFNAARLNRREFNQLWTDDETRFLAYVFAMRSRSRSQILQDLWVCFELEEKRNGFFVEFGATDGKTNSNTWLLEHQFGWSGILAEPNPYWHADLAAHRAAAVDHRCVYSTTGEKVSFIVTDDSDPELSAIADHSDGDHFAELRSQSNQIKVETISLLDLLATHQAPDHIDYLSVDTEGSELEILSAFDFTRYRFSVLSVEQNPRTGEAIDRLLATAGYFRVFPALSQWDGWYVSAEMHDRVPAPIFTPSA